MVWTWDLEIHDVSANDAGLYECQVNTRPKISHQLLLNVHQGSTVISGPPEIYLETGSMLILTCAITAPPLPSGPVAWMHGDRVLDVKIHRGEVTLYETQDGPQLTSVLEISNVSSSDTGNYTCRPQGLPVAMVSVYVLQDEEPRAMHHDGASALEGHWIIVFLLLVVSVLILR
ncbi:hypothetical protein SK128_005625 [Halocaridina rubra]|uniref:Ig-like domain-containing protein n=1 Tax=Halocaridina rubra TaxID=373956 RepID=A0AAN8XUA4_HALRR